jgi:hypothetical protein
MQSVLAQWLTTVHNRDVEAEKVNAGKTSCRAAAWFNIALHPTRAPKLFRVFEFRGERGRVSFRVPPPSERWNLESA